MTRHTAINRDIVCIALRHIPKVMIMTQAVIETQNWLALLSVEDVARAVAYTQGNHWILLAELGVTLIACAVIYRLGLCARIADRLNRARARPNLSAFVAAFGFFISLTFLTAPFDVYSDWWRERAYDLSRQSLSDWAFQWLSLSVLAVLVAAALVTMLFGLMRRTEAVWWVWASGVTAFSLITITFLSPLILEPWMNAYTPAPRGAVLDAVTALATSAGIEAEAIYIYDGSRQSERFTANVSGLFGTARIALSDTMFLQGANLAEVRAVVAHEIGHFSKNHILLTLGVYSMLSGLLLFLTDHVFRALTKQTGSDLAIHASRSLPLTYAIFAVLMVVATPITNSYSRMLENAADAYSLQLANEPDGLANALIKTASYRAPSPHWLEELLFYSHPSVEFRILRAMEHKQEVGS